LSTNAQQALAHGERAAALYRRLGDRPGLASALYNVGQAQAELGHDAAAVAAYGEGIAIYERDSGGQAPDLTKFYAFLAQAEAEMTDFAGAEAHFRAAAASARRQGPYHVDVIQAEMRLGAFFSRTERWREALEHFDLASDVAARALPDDETFHLPMLLGERGYARALVGDPEAALPDLERATSLRRTARQETLFSAQLLGDEAFALVELGRYGDALARLDEAEVIQKENQAPASTRANNVGVRARMLFAQGALDEAAAALAGLDAELDAGPTQQPRVRSSFWLQRAEVALARGDLDDAMRQVERAREGVPPDERFFAGRRARFELVAGSVALARGRPAEARALWQRALERRLVAYHPDALPIAEAQIMVARALFVEQRADEARALYRKAQAIHRKHAEVPPADRRALEALGAALRAGE
jgi:tetratricopeptide (TPR) repeat protein